MIMEHALYAPTLQPVFADRRADPSPSASAFNGALVDLMPSLRSFARALTRNPALADDLVQDTSEKALAHAASFVSGTNMRAWLFTILRNQHYSQRRRAWRNVEDVDGAYTNTLHTRPTQNDTLDLQDATRAMAKLSATQQTLLLNVSVAGRSYDAVAAEIGCAVGTIKSRVSRARTRLAKYLA
jgi:RNA polymerase sigma factor (sigma-70 family)